MVTKSGVISTVDMIKCLKQIRSQKVEVWKQSHYYVKSSKSEVLLNKIFLFLLQQLKKLKRQIFWN